MAHIHYSIECRKVFTTAVLFLQAKGLQVSEATRRKRRWQTTAVKSQLQVSRCMKENSR